MTDAEIERVEGMILRVMDSSMTVEIARAYAELFKATAFHRAVNLLAEEFGLQGPELRSSELQSQALE